MAERVQHATPPGRDAIAQRGGFQNGPAILKDEAEQHQHGDGREQERRVVTRKSGLHRQDEAGFRKAASEREDGDAETMSGFHVLEK